jgi:hypothetical protein
LPSFLGRSKFTKDDAMSRHVLFIAPFVAPLCVLGCAKATPPPEAAADHHDVPITEADVKLPASYAEAVPRVKAYRDAIRAAIEAGTPEAAHRPLDELDLVLGKLTSIAKDSGIPIDHWEAINLSARALREHFNQLHAAIDEHRAPDYQAVATGIDGSIATLEQVQP